MNGSNDTCLLKASDDDHQKLYQSQRGKMCHQRICVYSISAAMFRKRIAQRVEPNCDAATLQYEVMRRA